MQRGVVFRQRYSIFRQNISSRKPTTHFFKKQPVYKQLTHTWKIAQQLSELNPLSLNNNKKYRLKKSVSKYEHIIGG